MNIVYRLSGTRMIKKLSVRFYHGNLDISTSMEIMLMDSEWNSELQMVIGNDDLNIHLQQLKVDILKRYNIDFCLGVLISKPWLQKVIKTSFMRPKSENGLVTPDYEIYVSDFASFWVDNHSSGWKVSAKKFMDEPAKNQYRKFIETLKEYEAVIGEKLQLRNTAKKDFESFVDYLETELYQNSTIERMISRLKFFFNRASEMNIEVSKSYEERIYIEKDDYLDKVYLTEKEIETITNKDFSFDPELNVAKQNLLILIHTGIRGGDFLKNMDLSKIDNDYIRLKTSKTGQYVVIPLHKTVKDIIKKNFGNLPPKMTLDDLNKAIKTICMVCEIDEVVQGKVFNSKKKRKVLGNYKKFELMSSHACRRGFATIYKGKISDEAICSILGWTNGEMLRHYSQTSKMDYAEELINHWNNK